MPRRQRTLSDEELFPDLSRHGMISVDCETWDPELKTKGPGWHRDDTYIAGVGIGTEAGFRHYYSIEHGEDGQDPDNIDRDKFFRWAKHELKRESQPKVGAHLLYDVGYLGEYGVEIKGPLYDVQNAEPLLDENALNYKLERLSKKYLGVGKIDDDLDAYIVQRWGKAAKTNPKRFIALCPASVVAPYGIGDVNHPLEIFQKQKPLLEAEGLWDLFIMESKLIPILHAMRRRAVRVDLDMAERVREQMRDKMLETRAKIRHVAGFDVSVWAADSIAQAFDELGLEYPLTPKTRKPSFTKGVLELAARHHALPKLILEERSYDKLIGTFIEGCILDAHHNGRVYCNFNQLKSDDGGTVSGRFSSSIPNLQFIPVRTEEGKLIRKMFIAELGQEWWKVDYSQIEYRLMAHDAYSLRLPGSEDVIRQYHEDPTTDFHTVVAELVYGAKAVRGPQGKTYRARAKTINFGIAYGEGQDKLAASLGVSPEEGLAIIREYHRRAPFMEPLSGGAVRLANSQGYIETLLGRRRRFPWGKSTWNKEKRKFDTVVLPHRIPGAQRVFTHAALNARIQGSAADIMKKGMVDVWESGVLDELGIFSLTVHDELDGSFNNTRAGREALAELKHILENTVQLSVPLRVDVSTGPNWGEVEDHEEEEVQSWRMAA